MRTEIVKQVAAELADTWVIQAEKYYGGKFDMDIYHPDSKISKNIQQDFLDIVEKIKNEKFIQNEKCVYAVEKIDEYLKKPFLSVYECKLIAVIYLQIEQLCFNKRHDPSFEDVTLHDILENCNTFNKYSIRGMSALLMHQFVQNWINLYNNHNDTGIHEKMNNSEKSIEGDNLDKVSEEDRDNKNKEK